MIPINIQISLVHGHSGHKKGVHIIYRFRHYVTFSGWFEPYEGPYSDIAIAGIGGIKLKSELTFLQQ